MGVGVGHLPGMVKCGPLLTFGGPCTIFFLEHNAVNALESGVNKLREASMCMCNEDVMQVRGPRYLCGHKKRPP